jgi:translation initiation factor 1
MRPEIHERVTVRRERAGRGGKTVTIAEGPGFTGRELEPLAREAARALGVGARVEGGALVLQGDQCERLAGWLSQRGFERVERGN